MQRRFWSGWVVSGIIFMGLAGCAGLPVRLQTLQVSVIPETIHPGDVVVVRVLAPQGSTAMKGRMDFSGSPVLPLKTKDQGLTWTFTTQIPIDAVWTPGRYRVMVTGKSPDGAELRGETWISAP